MGFSLKKIGSALGTVAGAVVGGPVGSVVGNVLGAQNEAKSNYKWQLQQETANNIALWNMQNAYNTPKEQMARFKEAGLNPNLIYGQTNTASPISTASANLDYGNTMSQKTLGNYLALSNLGIQKDLSSAQVRNIDNSIDMSRLNYGLARDRLALDRDTYELHKAMLPMQLDLLKYQVKGAHSKSSGIFGKAFDWIFGQRDPHEDLSKADLLKLDWD